MRARLTSWSAIGVSSPLGKLMCVAAAMCADAAIGYLDGRKIGQPHVWLDGRRQAELANKLRSNRLLRALVARPLALSAAAVGARIVPSVVERLIAYAGDVEIPS